ncbi:acyl-homoserine-lactone synthase [Bradyrhizobium sp. Gha]|uniref:acyl-homoserine-lactone synthase n=1 Tax=Bradyrhizobium sp. Gha TaxID=1855318 RepID=UPI0024BF99FA|nr:acyl-homoserine-lactone synthase [Bradyrhizobium sp. Gha]
MRSGRPSGHGDDGPAVASHRMERILRRAGWAQRRIGNPSAMGNALPWRRPRALRYEFPYRNAGTTASCALRVGDRLRSARIR